MSDDQLALELKTEKPAKVDSRDEKLSSITEIDITIELEKIAASRQMRVRVPN